MISPRSFSASRTIETSNSRCSVDLTPISILSKSMKTAILRCLSMFTFAYCAIFVRSFLSCQFLPPQFPLPQFLVPKLLHGGLCRVFGGPPDDRDDSLERCSRLENGSYSLPLQLTSVFIRDNAADDHLYAGHFLLTQQFQ